MQPISTKKRYGRYKVEIISNKPSEKAISDYNKNVAMLIKKSLDKLDNITYNGCIVKAI
ncbi:MAG: hypothetical protein FWG36_02925 [Oscillospiraceae bacterium]|nr:hypothetical protein [Oscillospiraceae bacterium]